MGENYTQTSSGIFIPKNYTFFEKPNSYGMTQKRLDELEDWVKFVQWGRRNPVLFAEQFFGVEFMDYQRYVFQMSWNTKYVVWCMSRAGGKSILGSIFIMTKSILIPGHQTYILCGVGSQSIELFSKIIKFAKRQIPSFRTLTELFQEEVVKSNANTDGFIRNPASYHFSLYNGASVYTLNGSYDNNRSKRSNLNFYDEAGYVGDEELFHTSEPFCLQDNSFGLGQGQSDDLEKSRPTPFTNQLIYASSAGRTDQYFFKKYREASLHMDAGDKDYFCADINSDNIIKATKHGVPLPKPMLDQSTVDAAMRMDKEKALREYGNIFTSEGGAGQVFRRADIIKNSVSRVPMLCNENSDKLFALAYDSARLKDNSVIAIAQYYQDPNFGWKMKIENVVSLADHLKKNKTPITTPNQVKALKQLLLDYNGEGVADYENIMKLLVDAGSGGAGVPITDFLCEDWEDTNGIVHRGLIDPEYNEGDDKKFPNAVKDKLKLLSPVKYKVEMYEAAIKMMELNLIEFTQEYISGKGYIELLYEIDTKGRKHQRFNYPSEEEEKKLRKNGVQIESITYHLSHDEEVALTQIDAMKTELVNMYRFKSGEKSRFDLAPEKADKMHDDRAYVFVMLAWYLAQLRRENITKRKRPKQDASHMVGIGKRAKSWKHF